MELTKTQKDILLEVGNMGIGNCVTSLSKMVHDMVNLTLPDLRIIDKDEFINKYDSNIIVVNSKILGDITGTLSFIFSEEEAINFIEILSMAQKGSIKEIDEMGESALTELTNIICGSYLSAMSDFSSLEMMPQPPTIMTYANNEKLSQIIGESKAIEINAEFTIFGDKLNSRMILIISESNIHKLIEMVNERALQYGIPK